ncbi:MAG: toll/interleukin-1 receptor domain-containing protein [Promethearchaeota archaeon]
MSEGSKNNNSDNLMKKLSDLLHNRPSKGRFREQLFWLVDIIYACKNSNNTLLVEEAYLMEDALGRLSEFLKTGDQQALTDATKRVEQFARIVKAAVMGDKLEFNIFLSYATQDNTLFRIPEIARRLEELPSVYRVFYWEKDSGQNIIEYMEENLERSKIFIHFCTENSKKSKSVKLEREAAIQLKQEDRIRIIPVFQDPSDIPLLIKPFLGVQFDTENFDNFIEILNREIFRKK